MQQRYAEKGEGRGTSGAGAQEGDGPLNAQDLLAQLHSGVHLFKPLLQALEGNAPGQAPLEGAALRQQLLQLLHCLLHHLLVMSAFAKHCTCGRRAGVWGAWGSGEGFWGLEQGFLLQRSA